MQTPYVSYTLTMFFRENVCAGNTNWGEKLSTVDLLIKVSFCIKVKKICSILKWSIYKLVSSRRSTALSHSFCKTSLVCDSAYISAHNSACYSAMAVQAVKSCWRERLCLVDLHVQTSSLLQLSLLTIIFLQTSYLNEEVNCTEPYPSVRLPLIWVYLP
jgi:hypothetical protein